MEVKHTILDINWSTSFWGVYDGHGGIKAAEFCQNFLHRKLLTSKHYAEGHFINALSNSILEIDQEFLSDYPEEGSGTTVIAVLKHHNILYVANIGDAEAILGKKTNGTYIPSRLSKFFFLELIDSC